VADKLIQDRDRFKTVDVFERPFCAYLGGTCDGRHCPSCQEDDDQGDYGEFDGYEDEYPR